MQNRVNKMLEYLENNQQFDFDKAIATKDAFYGKQKITIPFNLFNIIQVWEGFYIDNNDYYYKGHRLEVEYAE